MTGGWGRTTAGGDGRTTGRWVALLALAVVVGTVAFVGVSAGGPGSGDPAATAGTGATAGTAMTSAAAPTEIDGCTSIDEPGEYVLAADVESASPERPDGGLGACIRVRADDVTLRGGGHTVSAEQGGQPGVVGVMVGGDAPRSNVTVRNLTATRWGAGVAALGVEDAAFRNVSTVENLGDGFFVEGAPNVSIVGGTVRGSNTGVFLRNAPDARIGDLTVDENIAGIEVRRADGATVEGVTVDRNRAYGAGLFETTNATVAHSSFRANGFAGVALLQADGSRLRNLTVAAGTRTGNDSVGVYLNGSEDAHLVSISVADGNGQAVHATGDSTVVGEDVRVGETPVSFEGRDVALGSTDDPPHLPTERQVVAGPLVAAPTDADAHLSLSVHYSDEAVERASTFEDALSLYRFDAGDDWRRVETTLDADRNVASATVEELDANGTVVSLVGEGLAEGGTETRTENETA